MKLLFPEKVTNSLCARMSRGFNGQDANGLCLVIGTGGISPTLTANNAGGSQRMPDKDNFNAIITDGKPRRKYIVRRLTPIECARLQGFPDWWCEGLGGSDSAIYKAYGNGLALPCAYDVMRRIAEYVAKEGEQV